MKRIDYLFVGPCKDEHCKALELSYHQKIKRYISSDVIIVKDEKAKDIQQKKTGEAKRILEKLSPKDFLVLLDETGQNLSTKKFSEEWMRWYQQEQRVVFCVGGAFGVSDDIKKRAQKKVRLSDFVLPHELARVFLMEQSYRVLTIHNGEKYHHE